MFCLARNILLASVAVLAYCKEVSAHEGPKVLYARPVKEKIAVDGRLNEPVWDAAPRAFRFTQSTPRPGQPSVQRTTVSVLYDDEAVYVGAMLYEEHPDSIVKQLSPRDDFENSNTDAFGVNFDTYYDHQNATQFVVTAAGVQADGIVKFDAVDRSWNAAWYSRVHHSDSGWSVEMKIPYSALRFPKKDIQLWGVNFFRVIRRHRERSYWNPVDPAVTNVTGQEGCMDSMCNIKAPVRLALLPYFSAYTQNYNGTTTNSVNGGMDVKYGLNESFTLDMTLVPDFGQTLYDNKVLNLSPIEVRYDERRYFFTEGMDLFNKNDLFYSRRVGGAPVNSGRLQSWLDTNEVVTRNPATTRLYNATKVSGRTRGRTGIGVFNAVAAETYATVQDTVQDSERKIQVAPLTNYNVVVIDQAMRHNSYLSFINTNVTRAINSYNADVAAVLFKFADKANRYGVNGSTDVSQLFYPGSTSVGYRMMLNAGKQSGNYTFSLNTKAITDKFNPNDLGYLDKNNIVSAILYNIYNTYKPFWIINTTYNKIGLEYYRAYNPDVFTRAAMHGNHTVTFSNFLTTGVYWDAQPGTAKDFYEPRTAGRFYCIPANHMSGGFISSDYRKRFALDLEASRRTYAEGGRDADYWKVSPRFRFSNKLSAVYSFSQNVNDNDVGFVSRQGDSVFLGTRSLRTSVNTLSTAYIFTRTMSLKLDARHYWSQAAYSKYQLLDGDGKLESVPYENNHNINYNSFNLYMNFIWQFRPGSEMSVVYQNSIYTSGQALVSSYASDLNNTLQAPQTNSLSLKVIYYLDYHSMEKMLHNGS